MLKEDMSDVGKLVKRNLDSGDLTSAIPQQNESAKPYQTDLVHAIETKMSELGLNATQLAQRIGFSKSKVSEILNRKRPLSKKMAKALYEIGIDDRVLFNALIE
jgi:antitoxin component HigA of HigAB toxin-antitoxin module